MTPRRRRLWGSATDALAAARTPITRLTCHAPHPDPDRAGERCGAVLATARGLFVVVATADHAPGTLDEVARTGLEQGSADTWLRCTDPDCGKWNRFRLGAP